jgi:DNA primase
MSRIPQGFIQDLLGRTDIVEVIGARVELKRAGREYKGLSPFTNEKSPSFFVSPAKQMYFCFSSGKNGNAIGFLMDFDRLSFVEAVEELAKRAGLIVPKEGGQAEHLVLDGPLDALAAAERFYRTQLKTHQPAIEYLKKRGVSGDTAKLFGIGFAPDSWDALAKIFPDATHAESAGLLLRNKNGGVYDRFRNRVMFPIRDTRARVIGFGGRTLANDPAKYLNSPETVLFDKGRNLFGLYEAKQSSKSDLPFLLVVEGYMDVVMLAQYGIRNVVATLGTATTRYHLSPLFKSTSRVVFCFDGDRAGRSAARRALDQVLPEVYEGRECRFMFLPEGHDPDTLVQEIGADAFKSKVDQATSLSEFLLGELAKQVNLGTLDGRAQLAGLARPYMQLMRDGPLRDIVIKQLAALSHTSQGDVVAKLAGKERPHFDKVTSGHRNEGLKSARLIKNALLLLLEVPEMASKVGNLEQLSHVKQPGVPLLVETIEFFQEHPQFAATQLIEHWRDTSKGAAIARVLESSLEKSDWGKSLTNRIDQQQIEREFFSSLDKLRLSFVRDRAQVLLDQARERDLTPAETAELDQITRQLSQPTL